MSWSIKPSGGRTWAVADVSSSATGTRTPSPGYPMKFLCWRSIGRRPYGCVADRAVVKCRARRRDALGGAASGGEEVYE